MKKTFWIVTACIVLLVVVVLSATTSHEKSHPGPIRVGVLMPLTGELAVFGEKGKNGAELAQSSFATSTADFVYEDSGSDNKTAVTATSKLVSIDQVDLIIGPFGPDETLAAIPAVPSTTPVYSFSLCDPSYSKYSNLYCGYPGLDKQIATAFPFMQKKGIRTLSFVGENSQLGLTGRAIVEANASSTGYQIITDELINPNEKDARSPVAKVIAAKPDAVFVIMTDPAQALSFLKSLMASGYKGIRMAQIDTDPKYLKDFGRFAEGVYVPGNLPNGFSPAYTEAYKLKFGADPDLYSGLVYDMTNAALNSNAKDTAIPGFRFLPDRTAVLPLELWVAKNGQYVKADY